MSKELEAKIRKAHKVYTNVDGVQMCEMEFSRYLEMEKALTPPTADEVCMALSECLITKVVYKHKTRTFSLRKSTFNVELVSYYYDEDKKDYVMHFEFAEPLPPHLIVMIGRFYEGGRKWQEN